MAIRNLQLEKLVEAWSPRLQRAFLDAVYSIRDGAHIDQIVKMIENGDIDGAIRAAGLDPAAFRAFDLALSQAFESAANQTAKSIPAIILADGLKTVFRFDIRNPAAEEWLATFSSNAIQQIIADQKQMIRQVLADGMSKGLNPRTVALDLVGRISAETGQREGGLIGLTASQAEWVNNFAEELRTNPAAALDRLLRDRRFDAVIKSAVDSGQAIPADKIDKMVIAYRNRALKLRADAIGRTEAMAALHAAQEISMQQAIDKGVNQKDVYFVWHTSRDSRVRDTHKTMEGQTVGFGEDFVTGAGVRLAYPGDPSGPPEEVINCRCWRETRIDFLANVA